MNKFLKILLIPLSVIYLSALFYGLFEQKLGAYKFNPFTQKMDYYEVSSGTGTETDPIWIASSTNYYTKTLSDSLYDVLGQATSTYNYALSANNTFTGLNVFANASTSNLSISGNQWTTGNAYITGNVGINTSAPTAKLHIANNSTDGTASLKVGLATTAISYASRMNTLVFNRNDFPTSYTNKITNSISGTLTDNTMNFELASGASTYTSVLRLDSSGRAIMINASSTNLSVSGDQWITGKLNIGDAVSLRELSLKGQVQINSSATDGLFFANEANTAEWGRVGQLSNNFRITAVGRDMLVQTNSGNIKLSTAVADSLVITNTGNVGIGTTSPTTKLSVVGSTTISNLNVANCDVKSDSLGGLYCGIDATGGGGLTGSTGQIAYFSGTNTAVGTSTISIDTDGRVKFAQTPYVVTSSRRINDNQTFSADFFNNTAGLYPFVGTPISSGVSGLSSIQSAQSLGYISLSDSTTANGGYRITTNNNDLLVIRGGESYQATLRIVSTSNKIIRFGFFDTTTFADATDGIYFEFDWNVSGTTIYGKTSKANVRSTTATAYTFTVNTDYNFKIKVNDSATLATFSIEDFDGNILWSDTLVTNIPTGAVGVGIIATESTTSAAAVMLFIDYMEFTIPRKLFR